MTRRSSSDGCHGGVVGGEAGLLLSSSLLGVGGVSGPFRYRWTRSRIDIGGGSRPSSDADNFCFGGTFDGGGTGCGKSEFVRVGGGTGFGDEVFRPV